MGSIRTSHPSHDGRPSTIAGSHTDRGDPTVISIETIKHWWWIGAVAVVLLMVPLWVMAHPHVTCAKGSGGGHVSITRSSPTVPKGTYTVKPGQSAPIHRSPDRSSDRSSPILSVDRSTPTRISTRTHVVERHTPVYIEHHSGGLSWWDYMLLYQWTHPRPTYYPAVPVSGAPAEHQH